MIYILKNNFYFKHLSEKVMFMYFEYYILIAKKTISNYKEPYITFQSF